MINLDAPAFCIPGKSLACILKSMDLRGGQEHPFQRRLDALWIVDLSGIYHPDVYGSVVFAARRPECNRSIADFKFGFPLQLTASAGDMDHLHARDRLCGHLLPKKVRFGFAVPSSLATHQKFWSIRIFCSLQKQLIDIGFPVPDANEHCVGTSFLDLTDRLIAPEPFHALLLLNGQLLPAVPLPFILGVACPALHIEKSKRGSVCSKRHRVMDEQSNRTIVLIIGWTQTLHAFMGCIVHTGCILYGQNNIIGLDAFDGRFQMSPKHFIHAHSLIFEKTIGSLGLCMRLTGLCDWGLRLPIKVSCQLEEASIETRIIELRRAQFLFHPVGRFINVARSLPQTNLGFLAQNLLPVFAQGVKKNLFGSAIPALIGPTAARLPNMYPVSGTITGPRKPLRIDKCFQYNRFDAVTDDPVLCNTVSALAQYVRSQIMHLNCRYNQEAAITYHPLKVGSSGSFGPSDEFVALHERPGCTAETHGAYIAVSRTVNQIPDLSSDQRPTSKIMIFVHKTFPGHGRLARVTYDHLNVNAPHIGKTTSDTGDLGRIGLPPLRLMFKRATLFGMWEIDKAFAVQNGQGFATGRFLKPAAGGTPLIAFADLTSQRPSRYRRRLVECLTNPMDLIPVEFKATYSHDLEIATKHQWGQVCPATINKLFSSRPAPRGLGARVGNSQRQGRGVPFPLMCRPPANGRTHRWQFTYPLTLPLPPRERSPPPDYV